jgi:hypothetical protein
MDDGSGHCTTKALRHRWSLLPNRSAVAMATRACNPACVRGERAWLPGAATSSQHAFAARARLRRAASHGD